MQQGVLVHDLRKALIITNQFPKREKRNTDTSSCRFVALLSVFILIFMQGTGRFGDSRQGNPYIGGRRPTCRFFLAIV